MKKFLFGTIIVFYLCHSYLALGSNTNIKINFKISDTSHLTALYDYTIKLLINYPDSALIYTKILFINAKRLKSKKFEGKALYATGVAFFNSNNLLEAEKNLNASILVLKPMSDYTTVSLAYNYIAAIYSQKGYLFKAINILNTALSIGQKARSDLSLAQVNNTFGVIYDIRNDKINARRFYSNALKHSKLASDSVTMAVAIGNLGNTYDFNDINQLHYYNKALALTKIINNKKLEGYVLRSLAERQLYFNHYDSAFYYSNNSLVVSKEIRDYYQISACYNLISRIYLNSHKYLQSIKAANKSIFYNSRNQDLYIYSSVYHILYKSFKKLNKQDSALYFHELFTKFQDSITTKEQLKLIIQKESEIEFNHKEDSLHQQQLSNKILARQQIQKEKIIRNSFIATSVLLIILIFFIINRVKLKRSIEIERMRSQLSRDLHDDIGSTLSSINILSHTAQKLESDSNSDRTRSSLQKINERSQRLLDSMNDIIWNIKPGNDNIEEVINRMREYASSILDAKGIDYNINFPEKLAGSKLSMEVKSNIYLIFKEAINNLVKYSECTMARITLSFNDKKINLLVEDNGKGFQISNEEGIFYCLNGRKGGTGLINIQQRAKEINATFQINSVPGKGTSIELTIPQISKL